MRLITTLATLLPLASALPAAGSYPYQGAGTLLLIPYTSNNDLAKNPEPSAYGCLDNSGKALQGASTAAEGCGSFFVGAKNTIKSDEGTLSLVQKSPYPLAAEGADGQGFTLFGFNSYPGYLFFGDFNANWYTGGQTNGDEIHLNTKVGSGDKRVALYFSQN